MRFVSSILGIFVFLTLILSVAAVAQTEDINLIGVFSDQAATITEISADADQVFGVYVVIINPVNPDFGGTVRDVSRYGTISFELHYSANLLSNSPVSNSMTVDGLSREVFKLQSSPVEVLAGPSLIVLSWSYTTLDTQPAFLRIAPIPPHANIIYSDRDDTDGDPNVECLPSSGSWDVAGFTINSAIVALESQSFGSVKALFR